MTAGLSSDLRKPLDAIASWLAARDGYGFASELSEDEREIYRGYASNLVEVSALDLAPILAERADLTDRLAKAEGENERLRAGIQSFLDGNYDHPRTHRPMPCRHGVEYWNACSCCDEAHFQAVLVEPTRAALEQPEARDVEG